MLKPSSMRLMPSKHEPCAAVTQSTLNVQSGKLELLHTPLIKLKQLPFDKAALTRDYDWLVLTSKNAVDMLMDYKDQLSVSKIASIGEKTTERLKSYGFEVNFEPATYTQEGFTADFKVSEDLDILYPTSKNARTKLKDFFEDNGCNVTKVDLYEPIPNQESIVRLQSAFEEIDAITVSSSSSARILGEHFSPDLLCDKIVVAIGEITARTLAEYKIKAEVPEKETLASMINLLEELI